MNERPNIILSASESPTKVAEVACPVCIKRFLELFEAECVVGCCDWYAVDFSEKHMRELVTTGQASIEVIRQVIEAVNEWTVHLDSPCIIRDVDWYYEQVCAKRNIAEALTVLSTLESGFNSA